MKISRRDVLERGIMPVTAFRAHRDIAAGRCSTRYAPAKEPSASAESADAQLMTNFLQLHDTSDNCVCLAGPA
jgi:hypothetical protein